MSSNAITNTNNKLIHRAKASKIFLKYILISLIKSAKTKLVKVT